MFVIVRFKQYNFDDVSAILFPISVSKVVLQHLVLVPIDSMYLIYVVFLSKVFVDFCGSGMTKYSS